jgi:hypothetical protein
MTTVPTADEEQKGRLVAIGSIITIGIILLAFLLLVYLVLMSFARIW